MQKVHQSILHYAITYFQFTKMTFIFFRRPEQLEYPSASLIDEYGYVVDASSVGTSGPVSLSFPAYLPLYEHAFPIFIA